MIDDIDHPTLRMPATAISKLDQARRISSLVNRHGDAVACYAALLEEEPGFVDAWLDLGNLLKRTKQYDLALSCFYRVLELATKMAEPYLRCAEIFEDRGMLDEACEAYRQALEYSQDFGVAIQAATLLPVVLSSSDEIEIIRNHIFRELHDLKPASFLTTDPLSHGRLFFYLAYQGYNDKHFQQKLASLYREAYPELTWIAPHCRAAACKKQSEKVRIVFVSRFFNNHTIAKLNRGLITYISRQHFEVHVFNLGPHDWMSDLLRDAADHYTNCSGSLTELINTIASWEPDIVYYCDIGMEPLTYFLAFLRLAPFQCATWGHPVTTGISSIDCYISHELCELGSPLEQYSERLYCLNKNRALTFYFRPELPIMLKTRADFLLPADKHLYTCPQSIYKIHPEFDFILSGIIENDPDGHIVLLQGAIPEHELMVRQRLSKLMPRQQEQVTFLPRMSESDYLNLISLSDVLLDTIHFGGGNSSAEAFALGVPIVTLPSPYLRGRLTYAWYCTMGFLECVADSPEEYISIAVRLGTDRGFHEHATTTIGKLSHRIYEDFGVVNDIESFLLSVVR